eukprot:gene5781-7979_t
MFFTLYPLAFEINNLNTSFRKYKSFCIKVKQCKTYSCLSFRNSNVFKIDGQKNEYIANSNEINQAASLQTLIYMGIVSAPLGMMLDNFHGLFGVLKYNSIGIPFSIGFNMITILRSAVWVPLLFGFAGMVMSALILWFDRIFSSTIHAKHPSKTKIIYFIILFSFQYFISGLLDYNNVNIIIDHLILSMLAVTGYKLFDASFATIILGICTAIAGPVTEIMLINWFNLYNYANADILGVCSWIPWVYLLGAPAVEKLKFQVFH